MALKMKSLLLLLFVYGINGQGQGIWDGPDDAEETNELVDCVIHSMAGKCVASLLFCKTKNDGAETVTWRSTDTPCTEGVCCILADVVDPNSPSTPSTPAPPELTTAVPGSATGCGVQKRQTVSGFVKTKDNEADPGEYPWAVSILTLLPPAGKRMRFQYTGTGSLIHDRVVLTAARVLKDKDLNNLRVVLGEHDQLKKVLPKRLGQVTEVVTHDKYKSPNGDFNFALVFLKTSATSGLPHVGTVCLPAADYVAPAGTNCAFAGWGVDSKGQAQMQLTKTEVPILSHSACEERLRQSPKLGPGFQLLQSFTCAGGEVGKNLCGGAGGSPLVCPIQGAQARYVQTGIVTWVTESCGMLGDPVVFADVAQARPWIDQQMASHLYTTDSYTYQ